MEDNKNPKSLDDCSNRKAQDSHQSVDDSLNQSRSYLCSFCIRGFSNAQALGGHMNIHRRDRAKLRQKLIDEDDVVVGESDSSEVVSLDLNEQQDEEALTCDDDDQEMEKDPKLGFWVQENKKANDDHGKIKEVSIIDGSSSSHRIEIEGLDLELRLGQSKEKKTT